MGRKSSFHYVSIRKMGGDTEVVTQVRSHNKVDAIYDEARDAFNCGRDEVLDLITQDGRKLPRHGCIFRNCFTVEEWVLSHAHSSPRINIKISACVYKR